MHTAACRRYCSVPCFPRDLTFSFLNFFFFFFFSGIALVNISEESCCVRDAGVRLIPEIHA